MTEPFALPTPARFLHHGPWTAALRGDELAEIAYDGRPVLRGIRAVARNHNWLTLTPEVRSAAVGERQTDHDGQGSGGLECRMEIAWAGFGSGYRGTLTVRMEDGRVEVSFNGTAPRDFLSNRVGLVVLHRPDDAGRAVVVGHPDGGRTQSAFPREISPHQPFEDIASLDWERDGVRFTLGFSGDIFETEDQRNWTDASFKTYSTPLSLPFPVLHPAGSRVHQSVSLTAVHPVQVDGGTAVRVPEIVSWIGGQPTDPAPDAALGAVLVEVGVEPAEGDGTLRVHDALRVLRRAQEADVRIVATTATQALEVLERLPLAKTRRLAVFDPVTHVTEAETLNALIARARELGFHGDVLSGTRSHFTELNRNASAIPRADGTAYSITSQMHAVEPEAVMESVALQGATAEQALAIGGGRPVHVGPITIAPRFNAVGTEAPRPEELPTRSPLESLPFGAAWLLGSVVALSVPGVASLCYAVPEDAGSCAAVLLSRLAGLRRAEVLGTSVSAAGLIAYAVREASGVTCFLANSRPWAVTARVAGLSGTSREVTLTAWSTATLAFS